MTYLYQFLQRVSKLNIAAEIQDTLTASAGDAVTLQKEQLFSGINRNGEAITPPYAPSTVKRKQAKGQPTDRITGFDTGSMHQRAFFEVDSATMYFGSTSATYPLFTARYTEKVWGLSPLKINQLRAKVLPLLIESIINKL